MAFCVRCGNELAPDARFCVKCGAPAEKGPAATTSATPQPQPAQPQQTYGAQAAQGFQEMVASLSVGDKMIAIAALTMLIFGLIPVFEDESVISAGFELSFITGVALLLMPVGLLAIVIASWRNVLPSAVRTIVTAALGGLATAILVYWVPMFNTLEAEGTWVLWIWGLAGIAGVAGTIVDLQRGLP